MSVSTPDRVMSTFSKHEEQLRACIKDWVVDSLNSDSQLGTSSAIEYSQVIEMLHPLVEASETKVDHPSQPVMTSVSPTGSSSSLVISLSDQLEWQQSARTHSPRTPSAPEILRSLRKPSPPPPASRWDDSLQVEESVMSSLEVLTRLSDNIKTGTVRGEFLCFADSSSFPLDLVLPLLVRIVERKDDSTDAMSVESVAPLTVGSAWLSVVAEYTYESQLASLLRARKGLAEISVDDRRIINRFFLGKLSLEGLRASNLWSGSPLDPSEKDRGILELQTSSSDFLSLRLKKKQKIDSLEERRTMLQDQQNRLRKLLARELQRMHSAKPASTQPPPQQISSLRTPPAEVSNVVANMLKRFKPKEVPTVPASNVLLINSAKLRGLKVEWYRVNEKLRSAIEAEQVLERKIKRLRYDNPL